MRPPHRVVITGMGVATPLGNDVRQFWAGLERGDSGVTLLDDIDLPACGTRIGARVREYESAKTFTRRELERTSRTSQIALLAASQAIADARLGELGDRERASVGVVLGTSASTISTSEPFLIGMANGAVPDPLYVPISMNLAPAANVSMRWGFTGPLLSLDAACSSANHAIGYVYNLIRFGALTMALTGGAEAPLSPIVMRAWSSLCVLSKRHETPGSACRPFSLDRDGMVLGEHAGVLVLESEESALARGAAIHAELTGFGAASDGHHITQPSAAGLARAMGLALVDSGLGPGDIDYVNAHGTGTPLNDRIETAALKEVFGDCAYAIPVVGIKGAIGHSLAASGALELVSCVLSIRHGKVPPTINYTIPDPECDLDYVSGGSRDAQITHAMSNSFSFGGSNAVLVVSRYDRRG
jgi:3-oxoacyl-(acyl-carrier-protein) synthase